MFTLKSFGITTFDSLRELLERLLPFFFACPSRLASWFLSFAFSCWRTAFVSSSFFCLSRIESILLLILSIRTSCLSWTGSFAAIIRSRKNPNKCPTKRNSTEWTNDSERSNIPRLLFWTFDWRSFMYSICHAQKDLGLSLGTRQTAFSIRTRAF